MQYLPEALFRFSRSPNAVKRPRREGQARPLQRYRPSQLGGMWLGWSAPHFRTFSRRLAARPESLVIVAVQRPHRGPSAWAESPRSPNATSSMPTGLAKRPIAEFSKPKTSVRPPDRADTFPIARALEGTNSESGSGPATG